MPPGSDLRKRDTQDKRSSSRGADQNSSSQSKVSNLKDRTKQQTKMDQWVEPALSNPKPSYQDHGGAPYGVVEGMQPLGERPSSKVKARVRLEGSRKSVLERSGAAADTESQETPEGTPAPQASPQPESTAAAPGGMVDDEKDDDYAPATNGKKTVRASRSRAAKHAVERAALRMSTPVSKKKTPTPKREASPPKSSRTFVYEGEKLWHVVESAMSRATQVGKPDLAAAVHEIYKTSLKDMTLRILLEAILTQEATPTQTAEFQAYVKTAKKKLRNAKQRTRDRVASEAERLQPAAKQGAKSTSSLSSSVQLTSQPTTSVSTGLASPADSTSKPAVSKTAVAPQSSKSATPSTEMAALPKKPKISLKVSSANKAVKRSSSDDQDSESEERAAKRPRSDGSLSSLTSFESEGDKKDTGAEKPTAPKGSSAPPTKVGKPAIKDHATEQASLAVPSKKLKHPYPDPHEELNILHAKKQKMSQSITRDDAQPYEESNVRPTRSATTARTAATPKLTIPASRNGVATSRAASTDLDSPLSDPLSAVNSSRRSTPQLKATSKPTGKRAKTKHSPAKKQLPAHGGVPGAGGAGLDSPIGDDDSEELASNNNDFCSFCGGNGLLVCCDGCSRSYHFSCVDPPIDEDSEELDEPWYCNSCAAKRPASAGSSSEKAARGIFSALIGEMEKRNPEVFILPDEVKDYFEGVSADKNGAYTEAISGRSTRRTGYSEEGPDYHKLRDSKGNPILCYSCHKSSMGKRPIVTCDHCHQHWHLDCLDPPLANPPALNHNGRKVQDWMCPLHVDQELRNVDVSQLHRRRNRTVHVRKPKKAHVVETNLTRGFVNNGIIEVAEESDESDHEFYDHVDGRTIYKLPAHGIKLDFIDKVKGSRIQKIRKTHTQKIREGNPFTGTRATVEASAPSSAPVVMEQDNFAKRSFNEQQAALILTQYATLNQDLDLGGKIPNLVATLILEASPEVVDEMTAAEAKANKNAPSTIPPSPPSSEQTDQLTAHQRKELELLQELIRRKLESSKT